MAYDRELKKSEVLAAFRLLFSTDAMVDPGALESVHQEQVKSAYRKKALSTHPDRFVSHGEDYQRLCSERFIEVSKAYDTLTHYLSLRRTGWQGTRKQSTKPGPADRPVGAATGPRSSASQGSTDSARERKDSAGSFWRRKVPRRYLRFAEFLYFYRVIPWKSLVSALAWQRQQRPRIGEIAQKWRWVNESQVDTVLRNRRPGERLGEVMVRHGLITQFELQVLLRQQQKYQRPIGLYFVRHGMMTEGDVGRYLHHQRQHNEKYTSCFAEGGFR
jgi:hypothetical protein